MSKLFVTIFIDKSFPFGLWVVATENLNKARIWGYVKFTQKG